MAVSRSDWSCFRKDTATLRTATYWMMVFQTNTELAVHWYSQLCVCSLEKTPLFSIFCLFLFIYLYDITVAICSYPAVIRRQQGLIH